MAMPTNGNAGAALAAYAGRAGIDTYIFCPADTPEVNVREIALQGAKVWRVNGYIDDCGKIVGQGVAEMGWIDKIGRAHVCTPVTNAHLDYRLLLEKNK